MTKLTKEEFIRSHFIIVITPKISQAWLPLYISVTQLRVFAARSKRNASKVYFRK